MPQTIQQSVEAELAKQQIAPKVVEPNEPTKEVEVKATVEPTTDKPEVKPVEDGKPEDAKDDFKPIEIDKKLNPVSYERFKEINDKYKVLRDQMKAQREKSPTAEPDNEEDREMKANFKKLWFITAEEQQMTKFQIQEEQLKQEEQQELDKTVRKLEREFDWSDGLPKFAKDDVLTRGMDNQVYDPQSAYIVMNLSAIINHFVKKGITDARKQPTFARSNDIKEPNILPKEELKNLKGNSLTKLLTEKVQMMMGG